MNSVHKVKNCGKFSLQLTAETSGNMQTTQGLTAMNLHNF